MRVMRKIGSIMFFCLLAATPSESKADVFTIRGLQWGASADSVKATEKATLKRETANGAVKYLIYSDTFVGEQVSVVYRLIHDKLFEVTYQFENKNRSCEQMKGKFNEVVSELSSKNGAPSSTDAGDGKGCDANKRWELGDTTLIAHLSSDSGKVDLAVSANSKELEKLAEQVTFTHQ